MQTLTRPGSTAAAAAATLTTTTATTKRTTNSPNNNNNNNNNNLTLAVMRRTTTTTAKFHKRRRRRQHNWQQQQQSNIGNSSSNTGSNTGSTATTTAAIETTTAIRTRRRRGTTTTTTRSSRASYPNLSRTGAYLTLLLLTTTCTLCANSASASGSGSSSGSGFGSVSTTISSAMSASEPASVSASSSASAIASSFAVRNSPCEPQHWWDSIRGMCRPCTRCQGQTIPLRPCQLHIDTVCGSIYDLNIDSMVLAKTEPNWKERRKSSEYDHFDQAIPLQHLTHEQLQQWHEEAAAVMPLDWQTGALFIAVPACLLFFLVAACILIHHMRQWRRMERRLDQDVEELSTKLMAKLAEVQSLDGGTFFIGNADALRGLPAAAAAVVTSASTAQSGLFQPQHVLLPAEKHSKHQERRILKTLQPGNVYIEENNGGLVGFGGLKG